MVYGLIHKGCGGIVYRSFVTDKWTCLGCGKELRDDEIEDEDEKRFPETIIRME